jgi:uncharacterized membrane protein YccC
MLELLGWGDLDAARRAVAELRTAPHNELPAVRRLAAAADALLSSIADWSSGRVGSGESAEAYEPVVGLVGGNLPGTTLVPAGVDRPRLASPRTWPTTSQQALQAAAAAALAIVAGELISPQRFYWAVIAAFVAFTGTATVGETVRKSVARTAGTLGGLVVAVGLAQVTAGHPLVTLATLLGCIFLAFYLQALSYAAMVFFITLMLGELYAILNRFSDALLLVRLAETAAGAAAGILVSLLVLPSRTRPMLIRARRALLQALADLTANCASRLEGQGAGHRLLTDAIRLDESARQLLRNADSMVSMRGLDRDHPGRRHRVSVLGVSASAARRLVPAVLAARPGTVPQVAEACRLLSDEACRLADVPDLRELRATDDAPDIAVRVSAVLDRGDSTAPVVLNRRVQRLADSLALLRPRSRIR